MHSYNTDWHGPSQSYQELPTPATGSSPRDTVNGFRPLFRPSNNYDPSVYTADAIRNSLPPGFKFSRDPIQ